MGCPPSPYQIGWFFSCEDVAHMTHYGSGASLHYHQEVHNPFFPWNCKSLFHEKNNSCNNFLIIYFSIDWSWFNSLQWIEIQGVQYEVNVVTRSYHKNTKHLHMECQICFRRSCLCDVWQRILKLNEYLYNQKYVRSMP